jgi:hypothetical protein
MRIMCIYRAPGVTSRDYDKVRKFLKWEDDPPLGGLAHFISFKNGEAVQIDIWESRGAFKAYYAKKFKPALDHFGLKVDEPEILNLHNMAVAQAIENHMLHPADPPGPAEPEHHSGHSTRH